LDRRWVAFTTGVSMMETKPMDSSSGQKAAMKHRIRPAMCLPSGSASVRIMSDV
jgi:hypothetical protein